MFGKGCRMPDLVTLVLEIPALVERPAVGTSCCVTSAEALIAQELWMLPGIADTDIDPYVGRVTISFDPRRVTADEIRAALAEVGYPPARSTAAR
jgi:copper chaperone CopZ